MALPVNVDLILAEIKALKIWVLWKCENCRNKYRKNRHKKEKSSFSSGDVPERTNVVFLSFWLLEELKNTLFSSVKPSCARALRDRIFNIWIKGEELQSGLEHRDKRVYCQAANGINWLLFYIWIRFKGVR
jgi:hypothetical protein